LDQSFQLAQRWLLHDFMPSRISANEEEYKSLSAIVLFAWIHVIRGQGRHGR
jgi:hypothetical protein